MARRAQGSNGPKPHLRNTDMRDRELLHILDEVADEEGLILASEVANRLGFGMNGAMGRRTVIQRLVWMRKYGYVGRVDPRSVGFRAADEPRYVITEQGRALMSGKLSQNLVRELDKNDPGVELLLMREVSQRGYVEGDFSTASALRREFLHQQARRGRDR